MRRRGSVFVLALAVLAGLIALLAGVAATHHLFVTAEANRIDASRARLAAQSGIERAKAMLYQTQQTDGGAVASGTTTGTTSALGAITLMDEWAQFGQQGNESFVVGRGSFRIQVIDLASRINLNTATQAQLELLPLTSEQVESLLDFREASMEQRPEGAKDTYYNGLEQGYNAKLRAFDTLDELLQVKGFTASTLYETQDEIVNQNTIISGAVEDQPALSELATVYSFSPELNPSGEAKINVNGGDQGQRMQRMIQAGLPQPLAQSISAQNWPTLGQLLQQVSMNQDQQQIVLDNLTTSAAPRIAGRINLNTATESVLNTVPGITPDISQAIVQRQQQGFASLGEIIQIPGMTGEALASVDYFTVTSNTFLLRVVGFSGRSSVALEAIVDMQSGSPRIIHIQEPPYTDYLERWMWGEETGIETVLKEAA